MGLQDDLAPRRAAVEDALSAALAPYGGAVGDAMRYACEGGKKLRAILALESALLFGVPRKQALRAGAAVEMVHAYSLVHDDLPCMDDDDLRRGRPTVHRAWDEAVAVLVGDALQTAAFEMLADPATHPDGAVRADLCLTLARAAGAAGMVGGQAMDIAAESAEGPLTLEQVTALQRCKTGRLLEWPCRAGAVLGGGDPAPLLDYAAAAGLAFQIADDLLDVEGDAATMGKAVAKDAGRGKATFVSLMGVDGARAEANRLAAAAETALLPYGIRGSMLARIARYVVARDR